MTVEAPLSNGQLYSWREIESYPEGWLHEANLPGTWDLRGASTERVTAALERLVQRHEVLRTTYAIVDGRPVQRVCADAVLPLERDDRVITDYSEPERVTTELLSRAIPMTGSLCWRGILVSTHGAPMFLSLSFSHLIVDVWSVAQLQEEFLALLADVGSTGIAPEAPTPRELARREQDEQWRSRRNGADRHWRRSLGAEAVNRPRTLPDGATSTRIQATVHSRRLGALLHEAGRQQRVTPPALLMALVASGLGWHTGERRVAMSVMSSNRFLPEQRHVVGTLNQLVPVIADVDPDAALAEHVVRLHWASTKAYLHSSYDVDRITSIAAAETSLPAHFNALFPCWFNYLQLDDAAPDPADRTPACLEWAPLARPFGQPFDVRVTVRAGMTSVALRADPEVLSPDALVSVLRGSVLGVAQVLLDPTSRLGALWAGAQSPDPSLFPLDVPAP